MKNWKKLHRMIENFGEKLQKAAAREGYSGLRVYLRTSSRYCTFSVKNETFHGAHDAKFNMLLIELDFSVRAMNCFYREDIRSVGDLLRYTVEELSMVQNLGLTTLKEIQTKLSEIGLELRMA